MQAQPPTSTRPRLGALPPGDSWHLGTTRLHTVVMEACWRPMVDDVAGDFHDIIDLRDGRAAVVIGDAPGFGPSAAAIADELRAEARRALRATDDPVGVLERLDDCLARLPEPTIASAVCAIVDAAEGTVAIANAGHPPVVVSGAAGAAMLDGDADPLLGIRARRRLVTRLLPAGGAMHLYTDGLVERRGTPLGESLHELVRLCEDLDESSPAAELARRTTARFGSPADDATVLSVTWGAPRSGDNRRQRNTRTLEDTKELAHHA